jgi:hypothetical protein
VLRTEALVDRELLAPHLQLRDQIRVAAERKLRLDPRLDRAQAQLLQPARLDLEGERPCQVCLWITAPECERRPEPL